MQARPDREKPQPLWTALLGSCFAAGYDFQLYKISNPPEIDADPIILEFPHG